MPETLRKAAWANSIGMGAITLAIFLAFTWMEGSSDHLRRHVVVAVACALLVTAVQLWRSLPSSR